MCTLFRLGDAPCNELSASGLCLSAPLTLLSRFVLRLLQSALPSSYSAFSLTSLNKQQGRANMDGGQEKMGSNSQEEKNEREKKEKQARKRNPCLTDDGSAMQSIPFSILYMCSFLPKVSNPLQRTSNSTPSTSK